MIRTRSKKRNNYIHAKKRILQRYGIHIDKNVYNRLCNQIKLGRSIHLGNQTSTRTVHQVNLAGKKLIAVYNKNCNNICTVLYPGRSYSFK